jgi:gamma-glutamyltranspeptidase / glutathione hydrolase
MNIQAALEAPRFSKATFDGCDVQIEARIPPAVREELTRRGHILKILEPFSFVGVGQGEAVMRDTKRDVNFAGSDPRSDGEAIPQSPVSF